MADENALHTKVPVSRTSNGLVPPGAVCKLQPVTLCPNLGEDVRCCKTEEAGRRRPGGWASDNLYLIRAVCFRAI